MTGLRQLRQPAQGGLQRLHRGGSGMLESRGILQQVPFMGVADPGSGISGLSLDLNHKTLTPRRDQLPMVDQRQQ